MNTLSTRPALLAAEAPGYAAHLRIHGPLPGGFTVSSLAAAMDAAGLPGRGGAGFPAAAKLRSLKGRAALLVANGSEGDPFSAKDRTLLARSPHLVLDGLTLLAAASGARRVAVRSTREGLDALGVAAAERRDAPPFEPSVVNGGFVEGEASAAVAGVEGSLPARPFFHLDRLAAAPRGAALVHNVETLAGIALAARVASGQRAPSFSRLYTVGGDVNAPGVYEAPVGTPLAELVALAGGASQAWTHALLGGLHGRWLEASRAEEPGSAEDGPGAVHVVGVSRCPVDVTREVAARLAAASAGQCGPCRFGLPQLATDVAALADGDVSVDPRRVRDLADRVEGRGACGHPDGAARFLRSSLATLSDEFAAHRAGSCTAYSRGLRSWGAA